MATLPYISGEILPIKGQSPYSPAGLSEEQNEAIPSVQNVPTVSRVGYGWEAGQSQLPPAPPPVVTSETLPVTLGSGVLGKTMTQVLGEGAGVLQPGEPNPQEGVEAYLRWSRRDEQGNYRPYQNIQEYLADVARFIPKVAFAAGLSPGTPEYRAFVERTRAEAIARWNEFVQTPISAKEVVKMDEFSVFIPQTGEFKRAPWGEKKPLQQTVPPSYMGTIPTESKEPLPFTGAVPGMVPVTQEEEDKKRIVQRISELGAAQNERELTKKEVQELNALRVRLEKINELEEREKSRELREKRLEVSVEKGDYFFNPETSEVKYVRLKPGEKAPEGYVRYSLALETDFRKKMADLQQAENILNEFKAQYDNLARKGQTGLLKGTWSDLLSRASKGAVYPEVKAYNDTRQALATSMKAIVGEAGMLTQQDREVITAMVAAVNESPSSAIAKYNQIKNLLQRRRETFQRMISSYSGKEGAGTMEEGRKVFATMEEARKSGYRGKALIGGKKYTIR
ncbi:MAG: hypothetical protein QXH80_00050 [Candidatus Nanoarchaeia archaeon]